MRRRLAAVLVAAVTVAGGVSPTYAAGSSAAAAEPLEYVALGDSYSAASGVLPPDLTALRRTST